MQPRVSVVIGVYNCAPTLVESLDSIARQTYADWEMILCDDGSTDDTLQVARDWARREPRTRVLANPRNIGLSSTLDRCIAEARGELLARQDGDDISESDRLAKLVATMDAHPEMAVVSSWMSCFDEKGAWGLVRTKQFPSADDFLSGSPICHAPCMMRKAAVLAVGGYGTQPWALQVEDLFLWFRLYAAGHKALNLQEPLYRVRDDENAQSRRTLARRLNEARVRREGFRMLGLPWYQRLWAVKPILVWALPESVYRHVRGRRLKLPVNMDVPVEISKDSRMAAENRPAFGNAKVTLAVQTTVPGSLPPFFRGQLAWLEGQGLRVHTVSAPGEELNWVSEVERVTTHAVPMTRSFSPGKDLLALWRLVRLYRRNCFTIVHGFTPKGGFLGMLAAAMARCPVRLFTIWGLSAEPASVRVRLMFLADKLSCALAHKVFVECPSIAELAVATGLCHRKKLVVLPAWSTASLDDAFTDLTDLAQARAAARRDWGLPPDAVVLGFVGRVVRDKGVQELLEAFESLAPEFPGLRLLIVGVREAEDAVDQEILRRMDHHSRIHCTGFQKDVRPLFSAMDILVHPSYREGLPTAPLEAAARALPVIATRIPGCVDAVQDGVSGLLVAPRSARELAVAIRSYLDNPELRRSHGQNGRERVLNQYDRQKAWAALLHEYQQLLTERGIIPRQVRAGEARP